MLRAPANQRLAQMASRFYLSPGNTQVTPGAWHALFDPRTILHKVAAMPISTWNWKSQDPAIRHMGPMAQDFHAAFGLGEIPTGITTVDANGVALAAIQGLYGELKERDATIAERQRQIADERGEITELRERLAQVESLRGEVAELRNAIAAAVRGATIAARTDWCRASRPDSRRLVVSSDSELSLGRQSTGSEGRRRQRRIAEEIVQRVA